MKTTAVDRLVLYLFLNPIKSIKISFNVKPPIGIIKPGEIVEVNIVLVPGEAKKTYQFLVESMIGKLTVPSSLFH